MPRRGLLLLVGAALSFSVMSVIVKVAGERLPAQMMVLARALVTDPRIIVADEPTGDLDAVAAKSILELLQSLQTDLGKTLVMVTHDPHAAEYAGDVVHLEKGRIVRSTDEVSV